MYAIIDVETTGGSSQYERITEIAIVLHDGERVVDTFSTLLNPERSIPWNITQLTGISNDMVVDAPKFYEVAKRIVEITHNAVFVAHNVSFDYGFVKREFERLGYDFSRQQMCTVRLSRKAFPGLPSYSLSNLKKHFGIYAERSHRALDDTLATVAIFERILQAQEGLKASKKLVRHIIRESHLPPNITLDRLNSIPEACGVYYLYDEQGTVIYVGKSINIRKRLFEHFSDTTTKGEKMRLDVFDISYEVTGSELIALLLESREIKHLQPRINRAQRITKYAACIFTYEDQNGYRCLAFGKNTAQNARKLNIVADYAKLDSAKGHLEAIRRQHELCGRLCHLDPGPKACFQYHIQQCRGACVGHEPPDTYNERANVALAALSRRLSGSFFILEKGRQMGEKAIIAIINGQYYGYGYLDESDSFALSNPTEVLDILTAHGNDPEAPRIIRTYLDSNTRAKVTKVNVET
jgi:DNA polymerase III subunit epsilon